LVLPVGDEVDLGLGKAKAPQGLLQGLEGGLGGAPQANALHASIIPGQAPRPEAELEELPGVDDLPGVVLGVLHQVVEDVGPGGFHSLAPHGDGLPQVLLL